MDTGSIEMKVKGLELQMWEAFVNGDADSFRNLVSEEALMICGGYKESGAEYAAIVSQVRLGSYSLSDFTVKLIGSYSVLTNYIVEVRCPDPAMSGRFRVSSLWVNEGGWHLVFNQDSKLA